MLIDILVPVFHRPPFAYGFRIFRIIFIFCGIKSRLVRILHPILYDCFHQIAFRFFISKVRVTGITSATGALMSKHSIFTEIVSAPEIVIHPHFIIMLYNIFSCGRYQFLIRTAVFYPTFPITILSFFKCGKAVIIVKQIHGAVFIFCLYNKLFSSFVVN